MKIHLWCPGVDGNSGGIEKYSNFLLGALRARFGDAAVTAFAKNDRPPPKTNLSRGTAFTCTGNVPERFRTAVFSALAASRALFSRPNLIISTHLNFSPLARWLSKRANIPYWVSLHGIEAWSLTREDRSRGLREANLLLPVSEFTRDVVSKQQGLSDERFKVLPNAFDPSAFYIGPKPDYLRKRYDLSAEQRVILTVGRLNSSEAYKGHDRILRVLREVRSQMPDVRYVIVGDGDDRSRLEQLANFEGVADSVIFAGRVSADELNDHYNLCDLFAMPSTGEGFGIVFLEALACGKPVLGGNKDGSRDALRDGELGVLIDPDSCAQLSSSITAILQKRFQHPLLYQPELLRQKVIEHFGYEVFKATLTGCLGEVFGPIAALQPAVSAYP